MRVLAQKQRGKTLLLDVFEVVWQSNTVDPQNGMILIPHRIHGTGIFTYMKTIKNQPFIRVGKYTSPVDPMGTEYNVFGRDS